MKTFLTVVVALMLLVVATGCSSDKEKGMNRPEKKQDLPRAAPTENNK